MLLHPHLINLKVRAPKVFIGRAYEYDVGEVVVDLRDQHALDFQTTGRQRARRNLHALTATEFAGAFLDLRASKVWNKIQFFPIMDDGVAASRRAFAGFIEGQALAVFKQGSLQ